MKPYATRIVSAYLSSRGPGRLILGEAPRRAPVFVGSIGVSELLHMEHYVYLLYLCGTVISEMLRCWALRTDAYGTLRAWFIEFVYEMLIGSRCELMHMGHYVYDLDVLCRIGWNG